MKSRRKNNVICKLAICVVIAGACLIIIAGMDRKTTLKLEEPVKDMVEIIEESICIKPEITAEPEPVRENRVLEYPFNTMSLDWSDSQIEGFKEYEIPEAYQNSGGCLPIEVQQYIYILCNEYNVDYQLILAMIEKESSYRWDALSSCNAQGYMQIIERWHTERMKRLNVADLMNPYGNVAVGIDFLAELIGRYENVELALMVYNRGLRNSSRTGALDLWDAGQRSTGYSRAVLERAAEIREELMEDEEY